MRHIIIFGISALLLGMAWGTCIRGPVDHTRADKRPGTNGFTIEIKPDPVNTSATEPEGYVFGAKYTIIIRGFRTRYAVQTFRGFSLVAVPSGSKYMENFTGEFQTKRNLKVRRSQNCFGGISEANTAPKSEVHIVWQAPSKNAGCVDFRAMVFEYTDVWYMDDGNLTRKFCPIIGQRTQNPDDTALECCACDEAKYELTFDGHWSRETHPKDFPSQVQLTHFSDLIGASHSSKLRMWAYGDYATDGMKELAEWGNTYQYEQELKNEAKEIRTIIKARGLWYPNVQGTANAMFRTDKYHHLMSLASMLGPSPDWVVGVSGVNLCLPDCSWVRERTFNLLPFDAGTDKGKTYMSPNNPELPRVKIEAITTKSNPDGPFFDNTTDKIRPLATLTLRRHKTYPMECKSDSQYQQESAVAVRTSEEDEYKNRRECAVYDWTPWSLCSATCGKGIRMRSRNYRFAMKAQMFNCERQMTEKQFCSADMTICEDEDFTHDDCRETHWTSWSECSVTCGTGTRSRTRNYKDQPAAKAQNCRSVLLENQACTGIDGEVCERFEDPKCRMNVWGQWTPCTTSCGEGQTIRTRIYLYPQHEDNCPNRPKQQIRSCNQISCEDAHKHYGPTICKMDMVVGQCRGKFNRFYYNHQTKRCERFIYSGCKGNQNNFETMEECSKLCVKDYEADVSLGNLACVELYKLRMALRKKSNSLIEIETPAEVISKPDPSEFESKSSGKSGRRTYRHENEVYPRDENTGAADSPDEELSSKDREEKKRWEKQIREEIAKELGVPSIDTYISEMREGMICVPANHLADALGVGEVNDGGARVDCMTTEWSPWSDCSRTCGRAKMQRTRAIKVFPRNGGTPCPEKVKMTRKCHSLRPCPRQPKCKVTQWTEWSACSTSCGAGYQLRSRKMSKEVRRRRQRHLNSARYVDCRTARTRERKPCNLRGC